MLHGGALLKELRPMEDPCWRTYTMKELAAHGYTHARTEETSKNEGAALERRVFTTCSMNKEGKEVTGVNLSLERGRKCAFLIRCFSSLLCNTQVSN